MTAPTTNSFPFEPDPPPIPGPAGATSTGESGEPLARVLVVEDDPYSQDMLLRRLQARGFEVDACGDGTACLDRILDGARPPDLVLLDVNLPGLSGLEVVSRLRRTYSHDALPVILVTALGDSADVVAGLQAGANDYVVKPVNLPVLLARMEVCLKVKRGVALLMEAERDRAMLETLARACEQVAQPMTAVTVLLEMLARRPPDDRDELAAELRHVLEVTREAGEIIHRLRRLAGSRAIPYLQRLEMIRPASGVLPSTGNA